MRPPGGRACHSTDGWCRSEPPREGCAGRISRLTRPVVRAELLVAGTSEPTRSSASWSAFQAMARSTSTPGTTRRLRACTSGDSQPTGRRFGPDEGRSNELFASQLAGQEALAYIRAHPFRTIALVPRRLWAPWGPPVALHSGLEQACRLGPLVRPCGSGAWALASSALGHAGRIAGLVHQRCLPHPRGGSRCHVRGRQVPGNPRAFRNVPGGARSSADLAEEGEGA